MIQYNFIEIKEAENTDTKIQGILKNRIQAKAIDYIIVRNSKGQKVKNVLIDYYGNILRYYLYKYDEDGKMIQRQEIIEDKLSLQEDWIYNYQGLLSKYEKYDRIKEGTFSTHYQYNKHKQLICRKKFFTKAMENARLDLEERWEYSQEGLLVQKFKIKPKHTTWNKKAETEVFTYVYSK